MPTVRSITTECPSGDGSQLEVTTEGQDTDAVLKFRVTDDEGHRSVYVSADQLAELTAFIYREQEAYEAGQEDVVMCGDALAGEDCALIDEHPSVPGTLPGAGERGHITAAGVTWTAAD